MAKNNKDALAKQKGPLEKKKYTTAGLGDKKTIGLFSQRISLNPTIGLDKSERLEKMTEDSRTGGERFMKDFNRFRLSNRDNDISSRYMDSGKIKEDVEQKQRQYLSNKTTQPQLKNKPFESKSYSIYTEISANRNSITSPVNQNSVLQQQINKLNKAENLDKQSKFKLQLAEKVSSKYDMIRWKKPSTTLTAQYQEQKHNKKFNPFKNLDVSEGLQNINQETDKLKSNEVGYVLVDRKRSKGLQINTEDKGSAFKPTTSSRVDILDNKFHTNQTPSKIDPQSNHRSSNEVQFDVLSQDTQHTRKIELGADSQDNIGSRGIHRNHESSPNVLKYDQSPLKFNNSVSSLQDGYRHVMRLEQKGSGKTIDFARIDSNLENHQKNSFLNRQVREVDNFYRTSYTNSNVSSHKEKLTLGIEIYTDIDSQDKFETPVNMSTNQPISPINAQITENTPIRLSTSNNLMTKDDAKLTFAKNSSKINKFFRSNPKETYLPKPKYAQKNEPKALLNIQNHLGFDQSFDNHINNDQISRSSRITGTFDAKNSEQINDDSNRLHKANSGFNGTFNQIPGSFSANQNNSDCSDAMLSMLNQNITISNEIIEHQSTLDHKEYTSGKFLETNPENKIVGLTENANISMIEKRQQKLDELSAKLDSLCKTRLDELHVDNY